MFFIPRNAYSTLYRPAPGERSARHAHRGKPPTPSVWHRRAHHPLKLRGSVGSRRTAERSPECAPLPLLCRTSTSLGACGWSTGCLVLSSVRGLQMNVCWINGARRLVERSHECTRRSDQTISMHTRRSYRVWMGLSPSIELNHANGKSLCMPRRIAQKPQRIATSPALRRKSGSQQAAVLENAAKGALYRKSSRFAASGCASEPLAPRRPTSGRRESSRSAADASVRG